METAIRATSTNLEDVDVQRRLDVRLLGPSDNETGWDIFILDYNVDGPIGTVRIIIQLNYLSKMETYHLLLNNIGICNIYIVYI